MPKTASQVRGDIYNLLDQVIETGIPLEIERKGKILRVMPPEGVTRLSNLVVRDDFIVGDAADCVHMDWSGEWKA